MSEQIDWVQIETHLTQKETDWKKREESLQVLIDRLDQHDHHVLEFVNRNSKAIALQLNDLRSALVKLASIIVEKAALNARDMNLGDLDKFVDSFLRDPNLIKAIGSANKVINIHAANAFRSLFENNQVCFNALEGFYLANKDTKNISVRERIAEGIYIFVNNLGKAREKKMRIEGIGFFKKAVEFFVKDANANVRALGKNTKAALDKVDDALILNDHTIYSMEEESFDAKTMSRSREVRKSKNSMNLSNEKSKTMPIPRREPFKGMEIESDDMFSSKYYDGSTTKKDAKRVKTKPESVVDIIENPKKQIKEKVEHIIKHQEDFYNTCDSEEYKRLLLQFQYAKNFELKKLIVKLIEEVRISKFMGNLLNFVEKEKLETKVNYSFFMKRLLQEELIEFIEYFLSRNNAFSLKLLHKRFEDEEFDNIIADNSDILHSLFTKISHNIIENTSEIFVKMNAIMLEKIYQNSQVVTQHKHYSFSDIFLEKIKNLNLEMYNFLQNQKRKLGDKVIFKPNSNNEQLPPSITKPHVSLNRENKIPYLNVEEKPPNLTPNSKKQIQITVEESHDLKDSADGRLEVLMSKANAQTKKTVIKSIHTHLKNIETNKKSFSIDKLFTRTLEIL